MQQHGVHLDFVLNYIDLPHKISCFHLILSCILNSVATSNRPQTRKRNWHFPSCERESNWSENNFLLGCCVANICRPTTYQALMSCPITYTTLKGCALCTGFIAPHFRISEYQTDTNDYQQSNTVQQDLTFRGIIQYTLMYLWLIQMWNLINRLVRKKGQISCSIFRLWKLNDIVPLTAH